MLRFALVVSIALAAVLFVAAALKLGAFSESASALETYSVPASLRRPATVAVVALEVAIATALLAGVSAAAYAGAVLLIVFALSTYVALLRGRRGAPCGCFGVRSRVGPGGLVRDVALAAAFLAVPFLPGGAPGTTGWLALALAAAFAASWRWRLPCSPWLAKSGCCVCGWGRSSRSTSPEKGRCSGRRSSSDARLRRG